ncbi:MAG: hypothetical protein E7774_05365 [Bradyrhizobium sp.]|nr:MAG: hypothetical protein E7774_05365 [Bradyrhizobium sp.]
MNPTLDPRDAARFLRTLRVATQTTIAREEMRDGRTRARPLSSFAALAAKGLTEWRFPAAGLTSGDGLVLARLLHESDGAKVLTLQAQGAAGLSAYAQKAVRVRLGETLAIDGVFDRDGALHIVLDQDAQTRADFAALQIELLDSAL